MSGRVRSPPTDGNAAIDLTADDRASQLVERLRDTQRDIDRLEVVQEVVLTPPAPGQRAL